MTERLRRVVRALWAPIDVTGLVFFRVALGLLVSVSSLRFLANGWVDRFFVEPTFAFKYWGLSWVEAWPAWGMHLHFWVLAGLGLAFAAGLFYRATAWLTFVAFTYVELLDVSYYLNHYYLVSLLLFLAAFMPLGRSHSLDGLRRPEQAVDRFPAWCGYLLRLQVTVVYFYAGLAKLGEDWLLHGQPLQLWLGSHTHLPVVGPYLALGGVAIFMSWAGFLYDCTIWMWLSHRRTRPYAFALVVVFHAAVGVLFNIGMFPFIMVVAATVFFEPDWPRRFMRGRPVIEGPRLPARPPAWPRLGVAALVLYASIQILIPLRHFGYPGSVTWNEQGMRWSWKVMVRDKSCALTYYVSLPPGDDGRRRVQVVAPTRYLTDVQEREMCGQPDLILQLAHHIADDYASRGRASVQVRAHARVAMNGRRGRSLIDPDVDLTTIRDGVAVADWILPEPTEPPARGRKLARR
jgi:vitamin K-dependent gamma-carboxylase